MKYISLGFLMVLTAFLAGCSGSSSDNGSTAVESAPTVYPPMMGTPLAVDCAGGSEWICTTEYGTSIQMADYSGMIMVTELYSDFATVEQQADAEIAMSWTDGVLSEQYEEDGAEYGVLTSPTNPKVKYMKIWNVEGKTDYPIKCVATINADLFEAQRANIDAICDSVRVSE